MNLLPILQVEDDEHDVFFLKRAFQEVGISNPIQVVRDGQEAVDFFSGEGQFADRVRFPLPCLVLLDLKLPRKNGLEVLEWLRGERRLPSLPVIVFSSSAHPEDIEQAYRRGANSFVVKPSGVAERNQFAQAVKGYWLRFHELAPSLRDAALYANAGNIG